MAYDLAAGDSRAILRTLWRGLQLVSRCLRRRPARPRRPNRLLQRIRAMTMVNDHLLNDIGLNRTAIVMVDRLPEGADARRHLAQPSL